MKVFSFLLLSVCFTQMNGQQKGSLRVSTGRRNDEEKALKQLVAEITGTEVSAELDSEERGTGAVSFLCNFFVKRFIKGDGLACGCGVNLFARQVNFNCAGSLCLGGETGLCLAPKVDAQWKIGSSLTTKICTPGVSAVSLDLTKQGGAVETFDMPDFCLDIDAVPSIIPVVNSCAATLGSGTCGCTICESGIDIAIDCSNSTEIPATVAKASSFGCLGLSNILNFYDSAQKIGNTTQASLINPIYLLGE
jgi:hypothetical protein